MKWDLIWDWIYPCMIDMNRGMPIDSRHIWIQSHPIFIIEITSEWKVLSIIIHICNLKSISTRIYVNYNGDIFILISLL